MRREARARDRDLPSTSAATSLLFGFPEQIGIHDPAIFSLASVLIRSMSCMSSLRLPDKRILILGPDVCTPVDIEFIIADVLE